MNVFNLTFILNDGNKTVFEKIVIARSRRHPDYLKEVENVDGELVKVEKITPTITEQMLKDGINDAVIIKMILKAIQIN